MRLSKTHQYVIALDDDPMIPPLLEAWLEMKCVAFERGEDLLEAWRRYRPVAAFIDVHLGTVERGTAILPELRRKWEDCPLLVMTSDPTSEIVREALVSGADDFLRKPLNRIELASRLQLRLSDRSRGQWSDVVRIGDLSFDAKQRVLESGTSRCHLSPKASLLLEALVEAKGTVLPRQALQRKAWGETKVSSNALDQKIRELRQSVAGISQCVSVKSIYGEGVQLELDAKKKDDGT